MKNQSEFYDNKNKTVIIWREEANGVVDYWIKEDGVSSSIDEKKYNDLIIRKVLKLDHSDIASMFGYANAASYTNAARRRNIENGIVDLYERIKFYDA